MDIHTALKNFVEDISVGNVNTVRCYRDGIEAFINSGIAINNDVLVRWHRWLIERYRPGSVKVRLAALRVFLAWLDQAGKLPEGVNRSVIEARWKISRGRRRDAPYTYKQIDPRLNELLRYFERMELPENERLALEVLRNRAIIRVLFSTGMRVSECASLTREQVADGGARETIIVGKGSRERTVFFDRMTRRAISEYCRARRDRFKELWLIHHRVESEPLSEKGMYKMVKKAAVTLGLAKNTSPHSIRHYVARDLLNNDIPIEVVQKFLGHSRIETTMLYAQQSGMRIRHYIQSYQEKKERINSATESKEAIQTPTSTLQAA